MAQGGPDDQQDNVLPEKDDRLSSRLIRLTQYDFVSQDVETLAQTLSLPATGPGSLLQDETGAVLVHIRMVDVSPEAIEILETTGAVVVDVSPAYRTVTAYVSPDRLLDVAALQFVENVQEELRPFSVGANLFQRVATPEPGGMSRTRFAIPQLQAGCPGATTSEGDAQLKVDQARLAYSLDGTGVQVGVLSDSYDQSTTAVTSASDDVLTGDLPGPANPCGRLTPVNVISASLSTGNTDEGRGMLQIVHDLAPASTLSFASAFNGHYSFANNIRALRDAGADVIVDDVSYFNEPFFQDGPIAVAVTDVTTAGGLYFTSAGNSNLTDYSGNNISSYEASQFRPVACPTLTSGGAPVNIGTHCHDFDSSAGTDTLARFTVDGGGRLGIDLQWAEPWFGVQTDLDIYLVTASNQIVAWSTDDNVGGTEQPFEYASVINNGSGAGDIYLVIARWSGTSSPRIKYQLVNSRKIVSTAYNASTSTDTFGPSIYGHAGATDALSIAAVPYNDSNTPESFTSHGYPTYYFGPVNGTTPAAPLPTPETREKPDVAATDGGRNTFFGSNVGGVWRFYGTSAAAPHAAAVAALMKEQANTYGTTLTQELTELRLEGHAADIAAGSQAVSGAGLVDALAVLKGVTINVSTDPTVPEATTPVITYVVRISNEGGTVMGGLLMTDTIPSQTTYVPGSASQGGTETATGSGVITWPPFTIPVGSAAVRSFQVDSSGLQYGAQLVNRVAVMSPEGWLSTQADESNVPLAKVYLPIVIK